MTFHIATSHPIALESNDHLYPRATKNDNHANFRFNEKLVKLLDKPQISVLDLGCAGGGMVKTLLDAGHLAVGVEGSDYSQKIKRAAWGVYPDNLFTADVTKPFTVYTDHISCPYLFDVVTAWEFFEHIKEQDLLGVLENIDRHLRPGGWLMASIANTQICFGTRGIVYHHTIKSAQWWYAMFERIGLKHDKDTDTWFGSDRVRSGPIRVTAKKAVKKR